MLAYDCDNAFTGGTMVGYGRVGGHCDNRGGYIGAFCMKPDVPYSAIDGNLRFGACR